MDKWVQHLAMLMVITLSLQAEDNAITKWVQEIRPPARFADYQPRFTVREQEFTYYWWNRNREVVQLSRSRLLIEDHGRIIGALNRPWIHIRIPPKKKDPQPPFHPHQSYNEKVIRGENREVIGLVYRTALTLFVPHPHEHVDHLIQPAKWNHMDPFGFEITMGAGIQTRPELNVRDDRITFEWTSKARNNVQASYHATLSVDPVLGYVVNVRNQWEAPESEVTELRKPRVKPSGRLSKRRSSLQFAHIRPCGENWMLPEWQDLNYSWMFYQPDPVKDPAHGKRYRSARLNLVGYDAINKRPVIAMKPGGLMGFFGHRSDWGMCLSLPEGDHPVNVGLDTEYWDYAVGTDFPGPDEEGICRASISWQVTGLPPEMSEYVRRNSDVRGKDKRTFQVRFNEDFENQPLPLTHPENSIRYLWKEHAPDITTDQSRSGTTSIRVKGVPALTRLPQNGNRSYYRLFPQRRYRLTCWVKVEGDDTEAFVAHHQRGLFPVDDTDLVGRYRTASTSSGDWKKLTYDFTSKKNGEELILGFVCLGAGHAYFDDFSLVELREDPPKGR